MFVFTGKRNLSGASNYWQMLIDLRPYLFQVRVHLIGANLLLTPPSFFQCAAALYQVRPNSALFRLPALCHAGVQEWMRTTFPAELCVLQANAGSPIDLARIQNEALRLSLEEVRSLLGAQYSQLKQLISMVQRRTAVLSPSKGYSNETYARRCGSLFLCLFSMSLSAR
jgi:hypothetical protein